MRITELPAGGDDVSETREAGACLILVMGIGEWFLTTASVCFRVQCTAVRRPPSTTSSFADSEPLSSS